jgi:hypothetical protein
MEIVPLEPAGGSVYRCSAVCGGGAQQDLLVKLRRPSAQGARPGVCPGEVYFYQHVASRSGVSVPETYLARWDERTGRYLIVQEFLAEGRTGSPTTMIDRHDQEKILASLAEMHARWWNSPELGRLDGIRTAADAMQSGIDRFRSGALDGSVFLDRFGDLVHPLVARFYRAAGGGGISEKVRDGFSEHATLCHYDVSAKNVFLPDQEGLPPVFFDWELVVRGNVGHELAQFLSASTVPAEHGRLHSLVRFYHEELTGRGVKDYGFNEMWTDFRYGCLARLAAPIALAARGNPRADELALTLLPLVSAAAISTDAFELLDHEA